MNEIEFGKELLVFQTVGQLKDLLQNYSDHTPITICGIPGIFCPDESTNSILLETLDNEGLSLIAGRADPAIGSEEYMNF